jgi:hypothetical protein
MGRLKQFFLAPQTLQVKACPNICDLHEAHIYLFGLRWCRRNWSTKNNASNVKINRIENNPQRAKITPIDQDGLIRAPKND